MGGRALTASVELNGPDGSARADGSHVVLSFDNNRLLGDLFGQFDQNIVLIEQKVGVRAHVSGNHVSLQGDSHACEIAKRVLDELYSRLLAGREVTLGDVDGAIRQVQDQGVLFEDLPVEAPSRRAFKSIGTRRKTISARTKAQDTYLRILDEATLVFATGPAGTGKTYLAVAYAATLLERGAVDRLILSRPAVEAGERLGFLPGDMREKVDPYLRPLYDALHDMMGAEKVERGLQTQQIEVAPLAFMRGRTLANAAVILDEAQNTTSMQMKMFLTRLGENSKMIVTGDPSQIDLPPGQVSGLAEAVGLLHNVEGVGHIAFKDTDVVRHELVARIVRAYDGAARARSEARRGPEGATT
jgi:phosphate starvation-inducible PhoH-like protein